MPARNILEVIDISGYLNPQAPGDKERVITQVGDACRQHSFFQVKGHGVPLATQRKVIESSQKLFNLPREDKLDLSFLKNVVRRGYEQSGDSVRDGDVLPDLKESFFVGREEPVIEEPGWHGPNVWPDSTVLSEDEFRGPVWEYYEATNRLGRIIYEILLQGLGYESPEDVLARFTKKPVVTLKLIRTPPAPTTSQPRGQKSGTEAHTDFGGVGCLLQQPGHDGLEIWSDEKNGWVAVPAVEDVFAINIGDMIEKWSGGEYRSVKHRAVNRSALDRISCATFWLGDVHVTNPLELASDPDEETVGEQLYRRFRKQYGLWGVMEPADYSRACKAENVTCVVQ
ncbi:Uu.00g144150.m01.CDS01 [Anthostomella pinea]|uniref:Uu.00g144150.m01.CDS01 n=1 Tax=Anthostomella pinea TaxID=933095 RepID=A0AAI8VRL6_9PEZI|nr:Uu.00g144150.m01.CDS01 [Anthostomella pinea]